MLAVPCLTVFGLYRSFIDKLCTRAMVVAGEFVELLPRVARADGAQAGRAAGRVPQQARPCRAAGLRRSPGRDDDGV